jgi:hypothetical protein
MKKFTLLTLLVPLLVACNEYTNVTEVVEPYTYTRFFTVYREDWIKISGDESSPKDYFYYQIEEPTLTNYVFDKGVMQAFLYYTADDRDTMSPLPFSDFIKKGNGYVEEHFTVEFQPGYVTFVLKTDYDSRLPYYTQYDFSFRFLW